MNNGFIAEKNAINHFHRELFAVNGMKDFFFVLVNLKNKIKFKTKEAKMKSYAKCVNVLLKIY
jgi:hypothetical protein